MNGRFHEVQMQNKDRVGYISVGRREKASLVPGGCVVEVGGWGGGGDSLRRGGGR